MKQLILIAAVALSYQTSHAVIGGQEGNGGDMCENRFKVVRDDIHTWILNGGSAALNMPRGVTLGQYNQAMIQSMTAAKISCTDDRIQIGNAEKTCKNYVAADGSLMINCNTNRFMNTSESDQYVLVHHEYAGLAGFEVNTDESSDYTISNQITGFLADQVVKKLVVKPTSPPTVDPYNPLSCQGDALSEEKALSLYGPGELGRKFLKNQSYVARARSRRCNPVTGCEAWSEINIVDLNWSGSYSHSPQKTSLKYMRPVLGIDLSVSSRKMEFYLGLSQPSMDPEYRYVTSEFKFDNADIHQVIKKANFFYNEFISVSPTAIGSGLIGFSRFDGIITDHCWRFVAHDHREEAGTTQDVDLVFMGTYAL